jgi:hypothetical protein
MKKINCSVIDKSILSKGQSEVGLSSQGAPEHLQALLRTLGPSRGRSRMIAIPQVFAQALITACSKCSTHPAFRPT